MRVEDVRLLFFEGLVLCVVVCLLGLVYDSFSPGWARVYLSTGRCTGGVVCDGSLLCAGSRGAYSSVLFRVDGGGRVIDACRMESFQVRRIAGCDSFIVCGGRDWEYNCLMLLNSSFSPVWARVVNWSSWCSVEGLACSGDAIYLLLNVVNDSSVVLRVSSSGLLEWAGHVDSGYEYPLTGICGLSDGCVVFINGFRRFEAAKSYVIKFYGNGSVAWSMETTSSSLLSIREVDGRGDTFFIAGIYAEGSPRPFVAKLRGDGRVVWAYVLEGKDAALSSGLGLTVEPAGDDGCIVSWNSKPREYIVLKLSGDGVAEWSSTVREIYLLKAAEFQNSCLLLGDTGGFTPNILVYRSGEKGLMPGYTVMGEADVTLKSLEIRFSPASLPVRPASLQLENHSFPVVEAEVSSVPALYSNVLVQYSVRGFVVFSYLLGAWWLYERIKVLGGFIGGLGLLKPSRLKAALFLFMLLSCYGFAAAGSLYLWLFRPGVERFMTSVPEYEFVGSLLLAFPAAVGSIALLPLAILGLLNPNPVFGNGFSATSPLIAVPILYFTACLFAESRRIFMRPSRRDLYQFTAAYAAALLVGVSLGFTLAGMAGIPVEPLAGSSAAGLTSLLLFLILLHPFILIFYYAYIDFLGNIVRGRLWLADLKQAA